MNDEELIRWLRNLEPIDYELRHGTFQAAAANRIETLIAERDEQIEWVKRLADDLIVAESKLSKALSMLATIGSAETSGGGKVSVMAFHAREALAEIKGETT